MLDYEHARSGTGTWGAGLISSRMQMTLQKMVITTRSGTAPDQPASTGPRRSDSEPVLPAQSPEDTDAGWGEQTEPDDDERLYRERPPHWDHI
jgi:hypothetical protein